MPRSALAASCLMAVVVVACAGKTVGASDRRGGGNVPVKHRATAEPCDNERPITPLPGPDETVTVLCTKHSDSPSLGTCGDYEGVIGYFCHSPEDDCTNDSDCSGTGDFGGAAHCAFSLELQHFACSTTQCAG